MLTNIKILISLILIMILAIFISACSETQNSAVSLNTSNQSETLPADKKSPNHFDPSKYTIGFSQGSNDIEWNNAMRKAIIETCKENHLGLITTDAGDSAEKQVANLEDLINRQVNILLVQTYSPNAIASTLETAMDTGIPVIVMSTEVEGVDVTCTMTSDAVRIGETAAVYLMEKIKGTGEIVQLTGKDGSTVNHNRTIGLNNILNKYPEVKLVDSVPCDYDRSKALIAVEGLLEVHPNIVGIYANNDDMALGAIQAIEEAGKKATLDGTGIAVVSAADGINNEALDMVAVGKMYTQRNATFGREAVLEAIKILKGEKTEKNITIPGTPITQDIVDQYK